MISFEEAISRVTQTARVLGTESVDFQQSLGRVLAQDIRSDMDMPPFDKSTMDGYACKSEDLPNHLEIIEIIPAGHFPKKEIGKNQCAKIMTGAPVPLGADTVIMVEHTEILSDGKIRFTKEKSKPNISKRAEDVYFGDVVLAKGTRISAKHIPVFAGVGATKIEVFKRPTVAVISTGDELVEPNIQPNNSQIRNTNAYQLLAALAELNIETNYIGIAKDTKQCTSDFILKALQSADIILLSGAVSKGDYDFVPEVLKDFGIEILFHGIQVKPGQHTIFGTSDKKWFFGVPGNPVSAFVQFEFLIKPLIFKIMGRNYDEKYLHLPLGEDFVRREASRKSFEPIIINSEGYVHRIPYNGSAHINALSYADGFMVFEKGITQLSKNQLVDVRQI